LLLFSQVIGREREVARVMQILARRTKNNPILLGEPGETQQQQQQQHCQQQQ
jgi:ATP-dependent Clp protease ATP-binding subunit ClpA